MTQATQQTVSRVEAIINRQWAKMVKWQESKGWKWSTFDAEDTVQIASIKFFEFALAGKYDGMSDAELSRELTSLVRQKGFTQWSASSCKHARNEYDADGEMSLQSVGKASSHEESVDSMELIEQAFGEDLWIAQAMLAGESLNEIGTHRHKVGATTVKKRVKVAAAKALELAAE